MGPTFLQRYLFVSVVAVVGAGCTAAREDGEEQGGAVSASTAMIDVEATCDFIANGLVSPATNRFYDEDSMYRRFPDLASHVTACKAKGAEFARNPLPTDANARRLFEFQRIINVCTAPTKDDRVYTGVMSSGPSWQWQRSRAMCFLWAVSATRDSSAKDAILACGRGMRVFTDSASWTFDTFSAAMSKGEEDLGDWGLYTRFILQHDETRAFLDCAQRKLDALR